MRVGKVKESILKRSVLRQLHNKSDSGSPQYGEDAGCFSVPMDPVSTDRYSQSMSENVLAKMAISVHPVEGWTLAAERAIYHAVNSLAAAGATPQSVAPVIMMPKGTEERQLKQLMKEMDVLCGQEKISFVAGHTTISPYVTDLILSMTAAGYFKDNHVKEPKKEANLDVVVAGTVGREGAAMLAVEREQELLQRYAATYIEQAKQLFEDGSMQKAVYVARKAGAVSIRHIGEGGIFAGLWELAAAGKVGLDIALKRIPIRQHTIEVCEFFRLNPYMLRSGGTLLLTAKNGERIVNALQEKGISAEVIGRTTDGNDKLIRYDDEIRYLEPPKEDEYYKA